VIISYYVSITEFIQLLYTINEEIMVLKSKWNGRTIMQYIPGQPCSSIIHPCKSITNGPALFTGLHDGRSKYWETHRLVLATLNYSEQGINGDLNNVYPFLAC
jgi:hypothetical protein